MRRLIGGLIVAGMLAGVVVEAKPIKVTPPKHRWSPLCVLVDEGSTVWVLLGCWDDPPPKDPRT